ncbi:HAD family acid phosphatase [Metamycoplasma auris]|uniref:Putative secreted acid phosphatase n=1 Tax=Metamycoplasma auris TaxID=51363 RepID=A0A2W7G979_9BACT|nr:HAD family acid phosphatase [Metamycoplasma auris]PZW01605.1 putative secreted acid phosphatase [Metamycoplasma auris]
MRKKLSLLLGALSVISMPTVAISCNNPQKNNNENNVKVREDLIKEIENLNFNQKVELISKLNLDNDKKGELIAKLSNGAAVAGAIVWYMTSAEQRAAALQAYTLAKIAFDNIKKKEMSGNELDFSKSKEGVVSNTDSNKAVPVVFMDIDETVLVNEYTESWMIFDNNGKFDEDFKNKVDAKGNRKAVPGAIEFINHVFKNGGIVMFNSGIPQLRDSIEGIKKNLIKLGVKKEYVHDWMFWCSGVDTKAKNGKYEDKSPWKTALENPKLNKKITSKNQRMNDVSDNKEGWNFKVSDEKSGEKIQTKVIMKIGDDFNDFYDDAYKKAKKSGENIEFITKNKLDRLFTEIEGTKGVKVTLENNVPKVENLNWHQFNIQVPGNAMYGGWTSNYGYGAFDKLWKALKEIYANSKDNA